MVNDSTIPNLILVGCSFIMLIMGIILGMLWSNSHSDNKLLYRIKSMEYSLYKLEEHIDDEITAILTQISQLNSGSKYGIY